MGWRMRPQLAENGFHFDVLEACSAYVAQRPGVHIAEGPRIPCAFPCSNPGEEYQHGMWADIWPLSLALRSATAALQLSIPVQTRPLTLSSLK